MMRSLLRLNRVSEASSVAEEHVDAWRHLTSDTLRARLFAYASAAWRRCGDGERADSALQEAIGYGICTDDDIVSGEIALWKALFLWNQGSNVEAKAELGPALSASSHSIRALAQELLALIASSEGRFQDHVAHLEAAWNEISADVTSDMYAAANILMNLSLASVELNRGDILWTLPQRRETIDWSGNFGYRNFIILEHLAWSRALAGDHLAAFSLLRKAAAAADSRPWELQAFVTRSFLAREMGEKLFAQEEYEHCMSLAYEIDWNAAHGEDRTVLLELAKLVAAVDPNEARRLMDEVYGEITTDIDLNFVPTNDQRRLALEYLANGIVSYHEGLHDRAERDLTKAFDIWVSFGFKWRATQASVYLSDISSDPRFRAFLLENGPTFPNSWLAARARQASLRGPQQLRSMDGVECIAV
jgi:tetratricopeptide (TPR) repeat protein